jgi:uncharacterized protein (DUF1684 family)
MTGEPHFGAADAFDLLDWKHCIFDLYRDVRSAADPQSAWLQWRATRDRLYRDHPQSPLAPDQRRDFRGCQFYDYDPACRVTADVVSSERSARQVASSTGGTFAFSKIGTLRFQVRKLELELELAWNEGYGGGIFLAFTDLTTGTSTYGGGRYLLDTVKGSELGFDREDRTVILDFNFAYNPSCSYNPTWPCPLAPAANRLPLAVTAGEMVTATR